MKTKNKSKSEWVLAWLKNLFFLAVCIMGIIILKPYVSSKDGTILTTQTLQGAGSLTILLIVLILLYVSAFILFFICLASTLGIMMMLFFPDKKALSIKLTKNDLILILENGKFEKYNLRDINRIILSEDFDGIYINSSLGKQSYQLPMSYSVIEKKIDSINNSEIFIKEGQLIETSKKMNRHKNLKGVMTTYETFYTTHGGRFVNYTQNIDSEKGVKVIYYTKKSS